MEPFENKDDIFTEHSPEPENAPAENALPQDTRDDIPPQENAPDNAAPMGAIPNGEMPFREERPVNNDGGIFGEQSFAYGQSPVNGMQNTPYQGGTYGTNPVQGDPQYRNMYRNQYDPQVYSGYRPYSSYRQAPQNGGSYQPNYEAYQPYRSDNDHRQQGFSAYQPYQQPQYSQQAQPLNYQPSDIPPVSDTPAGELKKTSKGWIIALIISVVLALSAVMLLLAMNHGGSGGDGEGPSLPGISDIITGADKTENPSGVTVNINVAPKPVEGDEYYQDKETGLLTPAGAAKQVLPSIVNLYGYTTTVISPYNEASGVIISDDGYIITNAHAVEEISRVKAKLSDGREFEAKIIGFDTKTDLAVLKIEADGITPAVLGAADELDSGETVVAIGNAAGYNDTVTVGCVSHPDREINSYAGGKIRCIQTDAVLNFGNSGGALVNLYGQVVGIVTSKYSSVGDERVGFAIRTEFAVPVVEDIIEKGYVTGRPRVGVTYQLITADMAAELEVRPGMMISEISESCDIANTALQTDDIITELDGIRILSSADVQKFQETHSPGETVTAKVYRKSITGGEEEFEITFRLEENTGS